METAGLSGASGPPLEDYSVYSNLSDEELVQIAIERSLSENLSASEITRQTPCPPKAGVSQRSTQYLQRSSEQPSTKHDHSTSARPTPLLTHRITADYSSHNPPTTKHADR